MAGLLPTMVSFAPLPFLEVTHHPLSSLLPF